MKKFIMIITLLFCVCILANAQYQNFLYNLKGNTKATINGNINVVSVTIPNGGAIFNCNIKVSHPNTNVASGQNSQRIVYYWLEATNSGNFDKVEIPDIYGNEYSTFTQKSPINTSFAIQQEYTAYTEVSLANGFTSSASFLPVTNVPFDIIANYTQPTTNIQSNNTNISNLAHSLTSGCTRMQDAVQKIAQWVFGYINFSSSSNDDNLDMTATDVFNRKSGNCAGYTNLIIAMLRSVGIPARYLSGYILNYPYNIQFGSTIRTTGIGSGSHAVYEVYYSDKGWVMADPQISLNFCSTHFVRHQQFPDPNGKVFSLTAQATAPPPTITRNLPSITSFTNNYIADGYSVFSSTKQDKVFHSVIPGLNTGINDKIEITNGTINFKTGQEVSYSSTFTSFQGNTWPVNRFWSIDLYHINGTYLYASQDSPQQLGSSWSIKTDPILPDYQWLLDGNGRIFGEAQVVAQLNDGDIISAKIPLSIEKCNEVTISNQTYSSNNTIAACYVTLGNVTVQNNSNLIVDSEMGVTINGDINVNAGSVFETRASGTIEIPTLAATYTVYGLDCNSATSGGNVLSDGGVPVVIRGVCWGTSPNPTTDNSKVITGSGIGSFSATLSPVLAGTTYYVRSYASNFAGTGYGTEVTYTQAITVPILEGTTAASSITHNSASSGGNATSDGCGTVTARGICWATSQNPTTANSTIPCGSGAGSYSGNLTGLSASTTYYVRSYATNSAGTAYGVQTSFTTLAPPIVVPTLAATTTATSITQTTATSGGNVTSDGGATVSNRGICWSTSSSPTTTNSTYTTGTGTGSFTAYLTGLSAGTTYYVRSFATNSVGTGYGSQISFTTPVAQVPSLAATAAVTNISATSATSGGNITSGNGSAITVRGVCWGTSSNPTIANSKTVDGSGDGTFMSSITGLSPNTLYYVRAYATNGVGTAYGSQVSFTSSSVVITASISYQVFSTQPTTIVIGWFANLTLPAPSGNTIPAIITNASGSGTHTASGYVSQGQVSGIMIETVYYSRLAGANYTATCGFGTLPTGYVAGATGSVAIPKQ